MIIIFLLLISTRLYFFTDALIGDFGLLTSQCIGYKENLASLASNVTSCFIHFSEPLRLCMECNKVLKMFNETYNLITNSTCKKKLLQSDILPVINNVRDMFNVEWDDANCDNCYKDKSNSFTDDFSIFLQMEDDVLNCLSNFTNADLKYRNPKFEADWCNKTFNHSSCGTCHEQYKDVNIFYNDLEKKMNGKYDNKLWRGICGDMGEIMNMTRLLWSRNFMCHRDAIEWWWAIGPICAVMAMLLIFYCIVSTYFHNKIDMIMYKQRRLRPIVYEMDSKLADTVN